VLRELLLPELRRSHRLNLDRCAVDASHVHATSKEETMSSRRRSIVTARVPSTT